MSDNPIKLWPGPCEDGRETYFALGQDIAPGWERKNDPHTGAGNRWVPWRANGGGNGGAVLDAWYQVRPPAKLPDPARLPEEGPGDGSLVTTWGEMKGRWDLGSWERQGPQGWRPMDYWSGRSRWPDGYPIRIRRKETTT